MSVVINESLPGVAGSSASAEKLLGAWAASVFPVYCRDPQGRLLAANRAFLGKFAVSRGGLPATVQELLHPEDTAGLNGPPTGFSNPPHRVIREQRWRTPQGWRWITWEEIAIHDADGTLSAVQAVGFDITRQRVAEELYLKLSRAVEQSPVAIVITDAEGRTQYVNERYTQTSGYTMEDILERNIAVLREGHASEEAFQQFWRTVTAGGKWRGELTQQREGTQFWESVQVSCIRNPAGEITNLLCLREDITERRVLEQQLRQAQKMESLGTLAGGIAHDFNNILAVINGYAELCLLQAADSAHLAPRHLREIQRAAQRAVGLVRQILTFSRKTEIRFAPVDVHQLVRDLVALLGETFPRNVSLQVAPGEGLPPLLADQNQLQQIVLNLCVNARDAMPAGGVIMLSTSVAPRSTLIGRPGAEPGRDYACLQVADTGTGMTAEVRTHLFEPFFTTKPSNQGTGLGLAVVYGIVTNHQGFIEVDSTPGVGSTFRVYLPLTDNVALETPALSETHFPSGTERLLIVDDELSLRRLLEAAFTRKGYTVTTAADGLEAIAIINDPSRVFDAVLLDLNMPGATGLEVLKVIRPSRPDLPVVVLSGHLTPGIRAEFKELGHTDFVQKPYTLDDLGRQLRRQLDRAR